MAVEPSDLQTNNAKKSMCILHVNARSLENKHESLDLLIDSCGISFDAIMVSETWYTKHSIPYSYPNYKCFVLSRPDRRGGGVLLLIKKMQNPQIVDEFTVSNINYEILTVVDGSKMFSVIYRPPNADPQAFLCFLETFLDFASINKYSLFLGGDFNIDQIKTSKPGNEFLSILESCGFKNVITVPTRITPSSESLVDLIITNTGNFVGNSGTLAYEISDHLPIFAMIRDDKEKIAEGRPPACYQSINSVTLNSFRTYILNHNWNDVILKTDADSMYNALLSDIVQIYRTHFPYVTAPKPKKCRKPWITKSLFHEIKVKNQLYAAFVRTKDSEKWRVFKQCRNKLNAKLRAAKRNYFSAYFDCVSSNTDKLWKKVNSLIRPNAETPVHSITVNNRIVKGKELSDLLNTYFVSVGDPGGFHISNYPRLHRTANFTSSMVFFPTNETEIINAFKGFKNSKSKDSNDMQMGPVKYVIDVLAPILKILYNLALETGCFPSEMQIAKVIAIYKGGDINNTSNFRPISILPILSKGFEKIIHSRLSEFLAKHSLLSTDQYGFQKGKSTELALLTKKEYILDAFERKAVVLGLYIDFSKAFDCVNHKILLYKLDQYGVRGTANELLESYLKYRYQYVSHQGVQSDKKRVINGVPQGSTLGPLLFLIYLNDIFQPLDDTLWIGYADDTSILLRGVDQDSLIYRANKILERISKWCEENFLKINTKKTQAILYRAKNTALNMRSRLYLNTNNIEIVDHVKTLGVIFSENLTWDLHVEHVCSKLNRVTGMLNRNRHIFPLTVKRVLYNGLFLPMLNYCHLVWATTSKTNIAKLTVCQKRVIRIIVNAPYNSHTLIIYSAHTILPVEYFYQFRLACTYRTCIRTRNNQFTNLFSLAERHYEYNTREQYPWIQRFCRTSYGLQLLSYNIALLLNNLSSSNIDISTLSTRSLLTHFLSIYLSQNR